MLLLPRALKKRTGSAPFQTKFKTLGVNESALSIQVTGCICTCLSSVPGMMSGPSSLVFESDLFAAKRNVKMFSDMSKEMSLFLILWTSPLE